MKHYRDHEEASAEMFQRDPALAAEYLNSVLADGDETDLMLALRTLSKAFGGVQEVARQALGRGRFLDQIERMIGHRCEVQSRGRPRKVQLSGNAADPQLALLV